MVQVENDARTPMLVRVITAHDQVLAEKVEQGQQVSLRVPTLKKLEIACEGGEAPVRGQYMIRLWT